MSAALRSPRRGREAEGGAGEEVVRAVGAERMHERTGTRVTPRLRQRVTVHVAGAAAEGQRPVGDPRRGVVDVGLGGLHLGEHRLGGVERRIAGGERGVVLVDHRRRPVEHGAHRRQIDHVLREAHRGVRVGGHRSARAVATIRV